MKVPDTNFFILYNYGYFQIESKLIEFKCLDIRKIHTYVLKVEFGPKNYSKINNFHILKITFSAQEICQFLMEGGDIGL